MYVLEAWQCCNNTSSTLNMRILFPAIIPFLQCKLASTEGYILRDSQICCILWLVIEFDMIKYDIFIAEDSVIKKLIFVLFYPFFILLQTLLIFQSRKTMVH